MTDLYRISGASLRPRLEGRELSDIDVKQKPRLHWIAIASLRVDQRYQRKIAGKVSERNVIEIAASFDWSKFAPVVVSEIEDGIFAIIDGQHRTTAAALRGIKDVPCLVNNVGLQDQAAAFAAINGTVTAISTMQLHAARVAAGDPDAVALHEACAEAGVTICRYPVKASEMKVGETLAAVKLARQLARYGRDILVSALSCITKTGDGNIGFVKAPVVEAICSVLAAEPDWNSDRTALIEVMQDFDFTKAFSDGRLAAVRDGVGIAISLTEIVAAHIERGLASQSE